MKLSNCAGDLRVVRQRQRHAGVQRRRHRPVVARERVVDAVAERRLDLLRRDQVLIRRSRFSRTLIALAAGAELPHAIDQPLRVADRRHVRVGDQEDRVGGVQRGDRARVDHVAGVDDDVVVGRASARAAALRWRRRPARSGGRTARSRRGCRGPDLCFETSSLRKSLSRRCRFSIASSTVKRGRTPRNSATSPRHGFRSTMTVGRFVSRASSTRAVDRDRRRAGAALGAEEHVRHARRLGAGVRRLAARGRPPHRAVERLLHRARRLRRAAGLPGEELVGAGAHRLKNQVRLRRGRDREDGDAAVAGAQPLDGRHPRRGVCPDVDDDDVGRGALGRAPRRCRRERRRRAAAARSAV